MGRSRRAQANALLQGEPRARRTPSATVPRGRSRGGYIDCFTDRADRERIFDHLRAGETRVICNVSTLSTGVDLPMVSCRIDAKPTVSPDSLRPDDRPRASHGRGQGSSLVFDHGGNHLRLGMVTDVGQDHLDDGRDRQNAGQRARERSEPCPSCARAARRSFRERQGNAQAAARPYTL